MRTSCSHEPFAPDDQPGFWVDVGAGDPVADSVTHAFSLVGGPASTSNRAPTSTSSSSSNGPATSSSVVRSVGARASPSCIPGPAGHSGLSTLVPAIAERHYLRELDVPEPVEVEVRTLAEIVDQYAPAVVDFLKVDVEGFEHEVLAGANWVCFRPRVVVVEATEPNARGTGAGQVGGILLDQGYRFVMFDGLNRFYAADGEDELAALACRARERAGRLRAPPGRAGGPACAGACPQPGGDHRRGAAGGRGGPVPSSGRARRESGSRPPRGVRGRRSARSTTPRSSMPWPVGVAPPRIGPSTPTSWSRNISGTTSPRRRCAPRSPWARRRGCRRTSTPSRPPTSSVPPGAFVRCTAGRGGRPDWISEERAALHGLPRMTAAWHRPGEHLRRR